MAQSNIKTSVIIPVYNTEQYLETCVESVLAQIQREIEIILVDDGSTDGSGQMIREYEKKYPCVKAVFQENQKLGAARNAGVAQASGKYLYFLDSDDYIDETLLEKCYQESEKEQLDFVMFDSEVFVEEQGAEGLREGSADEKYDRSGIGIRDRVYTGIEFWEQFFSSKGIYSNAYLMYINTDFFRGNELFFEQGVFYEDMDWMVRLYSCAERIAYIPQKLHYRRIHTGSIMTVSYNDVHMESSLFMCRKMLQMFLAEDAAARQNMLSPVLSSMVWRVKDILIFYSEEHRVAGIQSEVIDFYGWLLSVVEDISAKCLNLGIGLLMAAGMMKETMHSAGIATDGLDLKLEECKSRLVQREFHCFPLNQAEQSVGIYGTGVVCDRFLALYQKCVGRICASIFFIDTYRKSGEKYQDYPLYNIADTVGMKIDSIIIASTRHREAMLDMIRQCHPVGTRVLYVPEMISMLYGLWADETEDRTDKGTESCVCHREVTV